MNNNRNLIIAVTVCLILNVAMFLKLGSINRQMESFTIINRNSMNRILSEITDLHTGIYNMQEENKWVLTNIIKPNTEKSSIDDMYVDLEFSVREIEKTALVSVLYKADVHNKWTEVPAINLGGNSFKAQMQLENEKSYQYQIVSNGSMNKSSDVYPISKSITSPSPLVLVKSGLSRGPKGENSIWFAFTNIRRKAPSF